MGLLLTTIAGLVVWIVLWAIGVKSFDAFLITVGDGRGRGHRARVRAVPPGQPPRRGAGQRLETRANAAANATSLRHLRRDD